MLIDRAWTVYFSFFTFFFLIFLMRYVKAKKMMSDKNKNILVKEYAPLGKRRSRFLYLMKKNLTQTEIFH